MPITVLEKNDTVTNRITRFTHLSAHTASPGSTNANEVSGGGYARVTPAWGTVSAGDSVMTNNPVWTIAASTVVTHIGFHDALSGSANYRAYVALANPITSTGTVNVPPLAISENGTPSA